MALGGIGEIAVIVGLLGACLVALVLVLVARREADQQRAQAVRDVAATREEAAELLADTVRRNERTVSREQEVSEAQQAVAALDRTLRTREQEVDAAHREASRLLADAERAAADRLAEAQATASARIAQADRAALERLEQVSGLDAAEARAGLVERLVADATQEAASRVRRAEAQARRSADARARRVVTTAVQRLAVPTSTQSVITVLPLPSEEMKGRIIGKEGRNIRMFEALTGVNVLIDEMPDAVVLSSFDPERREVAQIALEALMADGRIHPQRIEAAYAEALAGSDDRAEQAGHDAAERAGVNGLHDELVRTMGRLRLRTSYGQNVLEHLVESALVAAAMAAEVGADVGVARRGAFLHDVGKALTSQHAGPHAAVGAELARRFGESDAVVNAIAAHHEDVPFDTVEAVLVQAADAISAARPGARKEDVAQYIERMDHLEQLVVAHPGVRRALAMAAGREVRVVVEPTEVDDAALAGLATAIAQHIESELTYPGEVRVTVVRELRASATAG